MSQLRAAGGALACPPHHRRRRAGQRWRERRGGGGGPCAAAVAGKLAPTGTDSGSEPLLCVCLPVLRAAAVRRGFRAHVAPAAPPDAVRPHPPLIIRLWQNRRTVNMRGWKRCLPLVVDHDSIISDCLLLMKWKLLLAGNEKKIYTPKKKSCTPVLKYLHLLTSALHV